MSDDPILDGWRAQRRAVPEDMPMTSRPVTNERSRAGQILERAVELGVEELAMTAIGEGISFSEFETRAIQRIRNRDSGFSFAKVIEALGRDPMFPKIDGYERECGEEWAQRAGDAYDGRKWYVPWTVLRDLNTNIGSEGGYVSGTGVMPARDILRPWSVTARAGVEIVENISGAQTLPVTTGKATIAWLSTETTTASPSTPSIMQVAGEPKVAIGLVQFSRRIRVQASPEAFIRRELLRTAGTAVDQALISGAGTLGEPLGLIATPGIGTETGAAITHAVALSMKEKSAAANATDERITYLSTPAVRELLEQREVIADTGRFVWMADKVADRAAFVSTDVPTATLIAGDWSQALLLLWGSGIELDFNAFDPTFFKQGIVQARVMISCDTLFPTPAAFTVAEGVS
jgi:HK97 family phage major capsid protein